MLVQIRRLRRGGRPIPEHEASRPEHQATGDLLSIGSQYVLRAPLTMSSEPLDVLYDAKVLSINPVGMRIRGFEKFRGAGVLQEWECTLVGDTSQKNMHAV